MSYASPRTLIFGIDGGCWEILDRMIAAGVMPRLKKLRETSAWGDLESVVPVNSAAAWSSFLTGMKPEHHGVYDFLAWMPGSNRRTAVNASWLPRPTIFDLLKERGPLLSLKVPLTYPAWTINGAMVSGLPTPDDEAAFTYPGDLAAKLNPLILKHSAGRSWEVDSEQRGMILDQLDAAQISLERMTDYLLQKYQETQTCFVVARDVDELQHFFWDALFSQPGHDPFGYRPRLEKYFLRLDAYLGRMLDWAAPEGKVIIMSDHGFGPVEGIWHLNEWLRSKGFLSLRVESKKASDREGLSWSLRARFALSRRLLKGMKNLGLSGDRLEASLEKIKLSGLSSADLSGVEWGSTLAYAGNVGEEYLPIYINLQGREPQGIVSPEQYLQIREDLRRTLLTCTEPKVIAVHRSEEIFDLQDGRYALAPDLVIQTATGGVQSDFNIRTHQLFEPSRYRVACHRRKGMFLLHGAQVQPGHGQASLLDIPATLLAWLDVPIPGYFDGQPLSRFIPTLVSGTRHTTETAPAAQREFYTEDEEDGVREKLESLGYL
jgi:predicted AlkP superfamily phosphohydrolase/phosphomutase